MANNGEVTIVTLPEGKIPLGGLYIGIISNYQTVTVSGNIQINGDLTNVGLVVPSSVGPMQFSVGPLGLSGGAAYTATVPQGSTPGSYQGHIQVTRNSGTVARIVITTTVLDLAAANIEDLAPINPKGGVLQLLQVTQNDFITLP
jgi:hypothetical protein